MEVQPPESSSSWWRNGQRRSYLRERNRRITPVLERGHRIAYRKNGDRWTAVPQSSHRRRCDRQPDGHFGFLVNTAEHCTCGPGLYRGPSISCRNYGHNLEYYYVALQQFPNKERIPAIRCHCCSSGCHSACDIFCSLQKNKTIRNLACSLNNSRKFNS